MEVVLFFSADQAESDPRIATVVGEGEPSRIHFT